MNNDDQAAGCTIQFIGGPYDGHIERFPTDVEQLPQDLIWAVCENVFRLLEGKPHGTKKPVTSFAIYERACCDGVSSYRFVTAMSARQIGERCAKGDFYFGQSSTRHSRTP